MMQLPWSQPLQQRFSMPRSAFVIVSNALCDRFYMLDQRIHTRESVPFGGAPVVCTPIASK